LEINKIGTEKMKRSMKHDFNMFSYPCQEKNLNKIKDKKGSITTNTQKCKESL
jgi:hypothetical protein